MVEEEPESRLFTEPTFLTTRLSILLIIQQVGKIMVLMQYDNVSIGCTHSLLRIH